MTNPVLIPLLNFAKRLRFPTLFLITTTLFVLDIFIPDFIPFADELLLGLGALLLTQWKRRPSDAQRIEGRIKKL